ncbi:TonB-dependent receptor plug domain-containing protein [Veillonella tobetsuensis]|uniref:TonB-dependent receptor plug domain-containing protein n=1 Tax=Veillonella tobetsuensis TaxID=1110546 RepID=UPI0007508317|nr:TonB-dependent receptor [Veillonella tobetsuensis]
MNRWERTKRYLVLSSAVALWLNAPLMVMADNASVTTDVVHVRGTWAEEEAKLNPQQVQIITKKEIEKKQAKSVEDIIFTQTGVSRTVDAMGRVGVSIRGAEARHTLILVDGQPVLGDFDKYSGAADEVQRLGAENVERIEVIQGAASAKYGSDAIGGVVNIITKKALKKPTLQLNAEGMRRKSDGDIFPFQNFYIRADSGQMGKLKVGLSGSKRDLMPVLASVKRRASGMAFDYSKHNFKPNVLRYYGDASDIGLVATYEANKNNKIEMRLNRYTEDLVRDIKHSDSDLEPQQHFKRTAGRNTINLAWNSKAGKSDWTVETNYSRIKEDDVALINYTGRSSYEGSNELRYIDNIDHKQLDVRLNANTQLNNKHRLSYGVSYAREEGSGSRLKSSPNTSTMYIDPWEYDKSLLVDKLDRLVRRKGDNSVKVYSHIHDYKFIKSSSGMPQWDMDYEYYGAETDAQKPGITYDDYVNYGLSEGAISSWSSTSPNNQPISDEFRSRYNALKSRLEAENPSMSATRSNIVGDYFKYGESSDPEMRKKAPKLNGKAFLEEYRNRDQRLTTGQGTIRKMNAYISDTWQVNKNLTFVPIIRLDNSSLFGSNLSASMGMTYNVNGNPQRRFKANIGTGYTEPGMGELWYNWEMYASNPVGIGVAKLGWYWAGNPNLKPEKSLNFDMSLEGENKNTYARVGIFHNRIKNYMSVYFTGEFQDFAPYLKGDAKYQRAPDMIYSFKNIGMAEITGLQAEVQQKFGRYWSGKLGYTYLHAINKSDPSMPKQLLDKPVHKIDIGVSYDNPKTGWNGSIWGDYYIDMLDSNTLNNGGNYWPDILSGDAGVYKKQVYQKKTFGIWNLMVQKRFNKNAMMYFGINNIFNHRDDDRATQERVYRIGVNLKFGGGDSKTTPIGKDVNKSANAAGDVVNGVSTNGTESTVQNLSEVVKLTDFIRSDFDTTKERGVTFVGDYRARWMAHDGSNRPQSPYRANSYVGSAKANMYDASRHSFEQRIRLGFDARLNPFTNLSVIGSMSGMSGVDTSWTQSDSKGFNHQRLDTVDLTRRVKKWDVSVGRLTEPMGASGYWFGQSYDGVRGVWTGNDTQVRVGVGSFKHSTGISDSAYTHVVHEAISRPPTAAELIGINRDDYPYDIASATKSGSDGEKKTAEDAPAPDSPEGIYNSTYKGKTDSIYFYQQLKELQDEYDAYKATLNLSWSNPNKDQEIEKANAKLAETQQKQAQIMSRLQDILTKAYPTDMSEKKFSLDIPSGGYTMYEITNKNTGEKLYKTGDIMYNVNSSLYPEYLKEKAKGLIVSTDNKEALVNPKAYIDNHSTEINESVTEIAKYNATDNWKNYNNSELDVVWVKQADGTFKQSYDYYGQPSSDYEFTGFLGAKTYKYDSGSYVFSDYDAKDAIYKKNFTMSSNDWGEGSSEYGWGMPNALFNYMYNLEKVVHDAESENKLPREAIGKIIGNIIQTEGVVLEKDTIPPIETAAFVQVKKQIGHRLGLQAWYLRSFNGSKRTFLNANGNANDEQSFSNIANVFGIGAKYQIGESTAITVDYGQNRSKFGRYMNGNTVYDHERGTADFTIKGHQMGGTPHFWMARLDIGRSDLDVPKSWNAFIDYKYFAHGSFLGGNGTGAVPDRYLDGIRSFTFGAGYVPRKDLLLEAFYTFDAKGTNKRDTLYGNESFKLGDYARIQGTYRF